MSDPNKIRDSLKILSKKIKKDLVAFNKQYADLSNEIEKRFREELSEQKGSLSGLEDFYQLSLIIKRNFQVTKQVIAMFMKMKDISSYNIVEESDSTEKVVEKLIEDLS